MTKDEKTELDNWVAKRNDFREEVKWLRGELENTDDEKRRAFLEAEMGQSAKIVDMIQSALESRGYPGPGGDR